MNFYIKAIQQKIRSNYEVFFVILLFLISVVITQLYNESKNIYQKRYINLINNLYFQKTINHIIEEINPKFEYIEHKVSNNESLNSIFTKYNVKNSEVNLIRNNTKNISFKNLRINQKIKFTIDRTNNSIVELVLQINEAKKN